MGKRHITGLFTLRRWSGSGFRRARSVGLRPRSHALLHSQFGQGSMLRIALLPAQTVVNSRNVKRQFWILITKLLLKKFDLNKLSFEHDYSLSSKNAYKKINVYKRFFTKDLSNIAICFHQDVFRKHKCKWKIITGDFLNIAIFFLKNILRKHESKY